ncbi:MAG: protein-glutamate O-methyltransferase CheR [Candidatus Omnitrophota bacterium]
MSQFDKRINQGNKKVKNNTQHSVQSLSKMDDHRDLKLLLNEVFKERGIDFSQYRENLLERRVAVRIRATKSCSYEEYMRLLKDNREEMDALLDVLTINVTQFFRDTRVFEAVKKNVIPELFNKEVIENRKIVRIWSCGSSAGEEATTVLILIAEYLKENLGKPQIYIYATDIDKWSIEKARDGIYEEFEFKDMPKELREKHFLEVGNKKFWRKKELNKFLFFKIHDIAKDDPPKSFDMILCRNLFIYFKRELQEICLEKFSMALNKNGFLVLGLTESLWGASPKSFVEFDRENRMYRKI